MDGLSDGDRDGLSEAEGLTEGDNEGERDGLSEADGETDGDRDGDLEGDSDGETDPAAPIFIEMIAATQPELAPVAVAVMPDSPAVSSLYQTPESVPLSMAVAVTPPIFSFVNAPIV
jgi:hypothetical protein